MVFPQPCIMGQMVNHFWHWPLTLGDIANICFFEAFNIFTLTYDSNVIMATRNLCCRLHYLRIHCAKYEPQPSKNVKFLLVWVKCTKFMYLRFCPKIDFKVISGVWNHHTFNYNLVLFVTRTLLTFLIGGS